jgi:undecaprenyl-diphosphatase
MFNFFSEATFKAFEVWLVANPAWAGFAIFIVSACESLAVVGLFIPGFIAMGIIGGLVSLGMLEPIPTLCWAILGAIVGDGLSYSLGRRFKHHLPYYWPFSRFPKWLARGKEFFIEHGGKSIIVGRFVGPVRPFIPVVAGMMSMDPRQFLLANVFSAIIWAPVYMFPGYLIALFW